MENLRSKTSTLLNPLTNTLTYQTVVYNDLVSIGAPEAVRSSLILLQANVVLMFLRLMSFLFDFSDTTHGRIAYDIIMEIHILLLHNSLMNLMYASLCKFE